MQIIIHLFFVFVRVFLKYIIHHSGGNHLDAHVVTYRILARECRLMSLTEKRLATPSLEIQIHKTFSAVSVKLCD